MKNYVLVLGLIGLFLLFWAIECFKNKSVASHTVKTDTLYYPLTIQVPVPIEVKEYVYKPVRILVYDTLNNDSLVWCYDTIKEPVHYNLYQDSVIKTDVRLDYKIKTLGELVSFEPSITVFDRDTALTYTTIKTKAPEWSFGAGLYYGQGKIQPSVNFGYKGFQVGYTNGIYLTKQWKIK